ncbi:MAG: histidine triad nucleotide-binding protein [Bacillota bacterium]|jgi:histidine triad (HIT) family protein|nr:histidine triad nucleotide-binding protein [Bacillota bacterium]HOB42935.1 histidine triad nucleotide-binding protein [Bacillota bacterium]HOO30551.1 histidine triad nucleotide-binding protein [Bacillota bacterium]HPZ13903.1 histidine triad nucleotide-binding protein [Bacillota bacterium]HQD80576.1 histidine triad nucleotide-binding protein [Bacillota bacterium]
MEECIFCRIARGEIDSSIVYEDENLVAFNDINPQAPMHVLIIPRMHVSSLLELGADGEQLVGKAHRVAGQIARERGYDRSGFRVVVNCGEDAGQSVPHLHFHVLGGRALGWPPG